MNKDNHCASVSPNVLTPFANYCLTKVVCSRNSRDLGISMITRNRITGNGVMLFVGTTYSFPVVGPMILEGTRMNIGG